MAAGGRERRDGFHELELIDFLQQLLGRIGFREVRTEDQVTRGARVDLTARHEGSVYLIEVKKDAPQTDSRLGDVVFQLRRKASEAKRGVYEGERTTLVLATPQVVSERARAQLRSEGVEVWDGPWIVFAASEAGLYDEVSRFVSDDIWHAAGGSSAAEHGPRRFASMLTSTPAGKADWSQYQNLCKDIFEYLFCPPLETPLWESANWSGFNRRDLILPNYAGDGIWKFLRETYRADLVVIDAKNYNQRIKKAPILQIAHYLSHHGTGLFGMIVSRAGLDPAAQPIVREQWVLHNKMIINLSDDDILQMLTMKAAGEDPAVLIRQKIEDFRVTM